MLRMSLALLFAGGILACNTAAAQCRGGTGGSTGTTGTGTTAAGLTAGGNLIGGNIGGSRLLTGPGSLAYDMMMANTVAKQMAQRRQQCCALEQQKVKQGAGPAALSGPSKPGSRRPTAGRGRGRPWRRRAG